MKIATIVTLVFFLAGCQSGQQSASLSAEKATTQVKVSSVSDVKQESNMDEQIFQWVPFRTSLATAQSNMEQHGFTCSVLSDEQYKRQDDGRPWYGFAINYPETGTNVCHLLCERDNLRIMFRLADNEIRGFGVRQ